MFGLTKIEYEQLEDIVYYGPVWAGDLISKSDTKSLVGKGLVTDLPGNNRPRKRDGIRLGGYVATDAGRAAYFEASGRSLMELAALSGIL